MASATPETPNPKPHPDPPNFTSNTDTELAEPGIAKVRYGVVEENETLGGRRGNLPQLDENSQKGSEDATKLKEEQPEVDDFGLPVRSKKSISVLEATESDDDLASHSKAGHKIKQSETLRRSVSAPIHTIEGTENDSTKVPPSQKTLATTKELDTDVVPSDTTHDPEQKKHSYRLSKDIQQGDVSEWSHQRLAAKDDADDDHENHVDWQDMPALGSFDLYDDYGRMIARGSKEDEAENPGYQGLGGASKGYTRVQIDDDAQSATSLDEDTNYLFKGPQSNTLGVEEDDLRDPLSQLQATKDLLTEGQRIAYVGVTRLTIFKMAKELESIPPSKSTRKCLANSVDSMTKWGQQMMIRLYEHMDIDSAEQVMIEQLAEHGVQPEDLVPPLMQNSSVSNPLADDSDSISKESINKGDSTSSAVSEPAEISSLPPTPPPPYEYNPNSDLPEVQTPSRLPSSSKLDIDLRWTVLCDLFLVVIADTTYDSRSRRLLESVGEVMNVSWTQICRFEKRIIDALEMQQEESKETWDEVDHMESRRKMALKKRYMVMGLATVGGGLVIGLSAGLLAPVIGAGLAAGFTTIGVSGTGAFLGGVGGTALITSGATLTGSTIAVRASNRRTGAVKTFEYRPLHNNKRLNLIVTVAGWMNGKVDDVRLPYSTVDPIMGDIYSVLWEPEMLQSMGATINILATEALTQGLQQVLGSTVLTALMASLQLPIVLTKLSYLIDNPWNVSLVRANAAGLILADSLMDRNLGNRPITLVGFSLGSRVIFSCLKELANKGAFGLVQNVFMFGSPVVANKDEYLRARSVVSGRFVNGFSSNDWILGYLFRATSGGIMRVAGLAPVENIPGLENLDVTDLVNGHMAYRAAMPRLLREVGWEVDSDEFTEIEDPDPDAHQERQRELIREIHEARKQAESKPDKKRFGFFKRGKLAEKKRWETYDVDKNENELMHSAESHGDLGGSVLFDIDAIKAELAGEQIQIKELESTLPPIKVDLSPTSAGSGQGQASPGSAKSKPTSTPTDAGSISAAIPSAEYLDTQNSQGKGSSPELDKSLDYPVNQHNDKVTLWPTQHDEIQMTFDTSYHSPSSHTLSPERQKSITTASTPPSEIAIHNHKPVLSDLNLSHNAWADSGDDNHSDSGIKMTFQ